MTDAAKFLQNLIDDNERLERENAELRSRQSSGGPGEWVDVKLDRNGHIVSKRPLEGLIVEFDSSDLGLFGMAIGEGIRTHSKHDYLWGAIHRWRYAVSPIPAKSIEAAVSEAFNEFERGDGLSALRECLLKKLSSLHPATAAAAEEAEKLRACQVECQGLNDDIRASNLLIGKQQVEIEELKHVIEIDRNADPTWQKLLEENDARKFENKRLESQVSTLSRAAEEAARKMNYLKKKYAGFMILADDLGDIASSLAQPPQSGEKPSEPAHAAPRNYEDKCPKCGESCTVLVRWPDQKSPEDRWCASCVHDFKVGEPAPQPERDTGWVDAAVEDLMAALDLTSNGTHNQFRETIMRHLPPPSTAIDERAVIECAAKVVESAALREQSSWAVSALLEAAAEIRRLPVAGAAKEA